MLGHTGASFLGVSENTFVLGTLFSVLIAAAIPMLIAQGTDRLIAIVLVFTAINNLTSNLYANAVVWQWNDTLCMAAGVLAAGAYYLRKRPALVADKYSLLLLLAIPIKLICQKSTACYPYVVEGETYYRYVYAWGDAALYWLVACYAMGMLSSYARPITLLFWLLSGQNLLDNLLYDPINFTLHEKAFTGIAIADVILYAVWLRWLQHHKRARIWKHAFIAANLILLFYLLKFPIGALLGIGER